MSRALALALALTGCVAAPAAAKPFVVATTGNSPSVAVDRAGTTHVAWDSTAADHTSTTRYCRVPRRLRTCLPGSERAFADFPADQDFGGPRVYLQGARGVLVVTARCCTVIDGTATRVYAYRSDDGGVTWSAATLIGTQTPDVGAALGGAGFLGLGITDNGTGLQTMPLAGGAEPPVLVTADLADSGGVGPSARGTLVAYGTRLHQVFAGPLEGGAVAFRQVGRGSDVVVASGPRGADLLYKTVGKQARYFAVRFADGRFGKPSAVSEAGFPIFGGAAQDPAGRLHVAWQGDNGLSYRVSRANGRGFGRVRTISPKFDFYNLAVAANAKGRAVVAYDSNEENGRVGGFTAG